MEIALTGLTQNLKQSDWWKFWNILQPFHNLTKRYFIRVLLYELNQMVSSSLVSIMLLLLALQSPLQTWVIFFAAVAVYFHLWMKQDTDLDWHICVKHIFPVYTYLKRSAFDKLMDQDMAWHEGHNSAVVAKKTNRGIDKVQETLDMLRWEFVPSGIQMVFTALTMLYFSPWLMVLSLVNSFGFFWMTWKSHKAKMPYRKRRHDLEDVEGKKFSDYMDGIATVKTYDADFVRRDYFRVLRWMERLWKAECMVVFKKYNPIRIELLQACKLLYWMVLVYQCNNAYITIASFVFLTNLEARIYHSLWRLGRLFDRISESSESVSRFVELQEQQPTIIDNPTKTLPPIQNKGREVSLLGVNFQYPSVDSGQSLLSGINFCCNEGQVIGIVGATGSGKSTLTKLIQRWYDVNDGAIKIDNIDIRDLPLSELQQTFAVIPQADHIKIFDDTLRFNLKFSKQSATDKELEWAAAQALLLKDIRNTKMFPQGFDTKLGPEGTILSGGQKQRLAIAQAILSERPLIIMDEPTSALDAETETFIRQNLRNLMHQFGKTVFVIAHRLRTISDWADTIIVLDNGKIVEEGSHEELCARPDGVYKNLVNHQALALSASV